MAKTAVKNAEPEQGMSISKVGKLNVNRASNLLGRYREEGKSIQHDLFPCINKALVEGGPGSFFAGIAMGEAVKNAVPSTLNPDIASDTLALKNVSGEKEVAVFYASNGGTKAKLSGIQKGAGVLIVYRGDKPAGTKGFNDWHDYGIEEFPNAAQLIEFLEAAEA